MALLIPEQYSTLDAAMTAASDGETISIARDTIVRDCLSSGRRASTSGKTVHLVARSGAGAKPILTGAVGVLASALTLVTGTKYTAQLPTGLTITGVTVGYFDRLKPTAPCAGSRGSQLIEQTSAAGVTDGSDTCHYNSATGVMTLSCATYLAEGRTLTDNAIEYDLGNDANILQMDGTTNLVIADIDFHRGGRVVTNANGAAVYLNNVTGARIYRCLFANFNDKGLCFSAPSSGNVNSNNQHIDCEFEGCSAQTPDAQAVWFTASTAGPITGARAVRPVHRLHGLYTAAWGALAPRPSGITGWSSGYGSAGLAGETAHVGTPGTHFVNDFEVQDGRFEVDPQFFCGTATAVYPAHAQHFSAVGTRALSGSPWAVASYPARDVRSTLTYGVGCYVASDARIARDRCRLRHNGGLSKGVYQYNSGNYGVHGFSGTNVTNSCLLESGCYIENTNTAAHASSGHAFLTYGNNSGAALNLQWYSVKSTYRDRSTPAAGQSCVMINPIQGALPGTSRARFHKCVFSAPASGKPFFLWNDWYTGGSYTLGSFPGTTELRQGFELQENAYLGWPATGSSSGGMTGTAAVTNTLNDHTEWSAAGGMDPAAVLSTSSDHFNATEPAAPLTSSSVWNPRSAAFETALGLNGLMGNNLGCWQNGQTLINGLLAARRTSRSGR